MQRMKKNDTRSLYFTDSLTEGLNRILHYPVTIIEAPMGYGKSTAVREYLKSSGLDLLWMSVLGSSILVFWKLFCRQFAVLDNNAAQSLEALGFPNDSITRLEALNLIEGVELKNKTVLVIDDYHIVGDSELNTFIEFLAVNEIPGFHIVITARYTNFQNAEELKLKGYMLQINKDMFEFSVNDIKEYYHLCGITVKNSDAKKLYDITEGWISALYLLMLNYVEYGSFETTRNINKLIENAVYIHFSSEIREFMQSICLFESFTIEDAVFVSGNENAENHLSEIINKNSFVKYNEIAKTYHVHKIFAKYLKDIFDSREMSYKKQIHQKLGALNMKNGNYLEAMEYFYIDEDFDSLLFAVEADRGHSIHNEQHDIFIRYFEDCPEQILYEHPIAMLVYAVCLFSFNEMEKFQDICTRLSESALCNAGLNTEYLMELIGEFEILLSFTEYNNIQKMYEHLKKARELLKHPAKFMDIRDSWTFGSPSVLYMFHRENGALEKEVESLKEALPVYNRLTSFHGAGGEYVMEAERYFNEGKFENAEILAHTAIHTSSLYKQGDIFISAMFLQTRIAIVKGNYTGTVNILRKMHEEMIQKRWYNLMHTVELCEAFIYVQLNQSIKVPLWIKQGDFESSRLYFPARAFLNIVYSRDLLISGEYLKLLGSKEKSMAEASVFPNLMGQIYTFIFAAAANEKIFRHSDAKEALINALDIAASDKIYMPFIENCDFVKALLEELYISGIYINDIARIFELYEPYQSAKAEIIKEHFTENKPVLTEREKEIAQLAAEGLTNKEIGEKLYISSNTVKMALKSIFSKLSINNRALLERYLRPPS